MRKKKSLFRKLLPWLISAALIADLVIFVGIPLYAPQETVHLEEAEVFYYEGDKKALTMENEQLLFEMDPMTTHFKLTEKESGRVWLSNPDDADKDKVAVSANKAMLQSTLGMTYSSSNGIIEYNNYQYSIENGNYRIEQTDDGIRVEYAIGKIEKIYMLPQAITVERMNTFIDAMSSKDAKKAKTVYTLMKPDKVQERDDKDELLALYPELANQELYILKSDTKESNKAKIAESFIAAGYTQEEYDTDMQLVAGATKAKQAIFNVTVDYKLDGGDFIVEVPYQEMRYPADNPITYVTVLPMFNAAGTDEKGFMFVPEGGGAIIRYNNGKLSQNSYYANMYGWDWGSERTEVVHETKNIFPVFGMSRADGSFICMVEGAESYAGVMADISMRYNSYNWACVKYNVIHSDRYNVSAKTERLLYMFEKEMPDATIVQRYRFLDSNDYVGMATAYGEYLREKHPELALKGAAEEVPVSVELVGAIDKTVVKFGLPVDSVVPVTTFEDAQNIVDDLKANDVRNLNIRFSGWMNGGVSQKVMSKVKVQRQLGGMADMKKLIAYAKEENIPLYFDGVSCFAYRSGVLQGFLPYRDAARLTTREQIKLYPYSAVTFIPAEYMDDYYLVQPGYAHEKAANLLKALDETDAYGVAFRDIGSILSADYNPKKTVTREEVKEMNLETIAKAHENGQKVMVKEGFDFVLPHADLITDMDLDGTNYSILDETVPFYQIAMHGMVDYTGAAINLAPDWLEEVLRCAEYGAGLNFTFMQEDGKIVQETDYGSLFGAEYGAWKEKALNIIREYQDSMQGLNQLQIVGHEQMAHRVTVTEYENGTRVYVNYSNADYTEGNISVPARSYFVAGRDQ